MRARLWKDPNVALNTATEIMAATFTGSLQETPNRFVGVKFLIKGKTHFGWVRITVTTNPNKGLSATITEYGYETIPNRPMLAGVASKNAAIPEAKRDGAIGRRVSLGSLALGVGGMNLWRRVGDDVSLKN